MRGGLSYRQLILGNYLKTRMQAYEEFYIKHRVRKANRSVWFMGNWGSNLCELSEEQ